MLPHADLTCCLWGSRCVACTLCVGNTWGICLAWGNYLWAACCAGRTQRRQQTMWRSSGASMASATPLSRPATLRCRASLRVLVSPSTAASCQQCYVVLLPTTLAFPAQLNMLPPAPSLHLRRTAAVASSQGIARGVDSSHLHELALLYFEHAEALWTDCLWATRWLQVFWSATLRRQPGSGRAGSGTAQ